MSEECQYCSGKCDCIPGDSNVTPRARGESKESHKKIEVNIEFRGKTRTLQIQPIGWRFFPVIVRKFRLNYGGVEWEIKFDRKNVVKGHNKDRPHEKIAIIENSHFPVPFSAFKFDIGWWLSSIEGGPRSKGRFGFFKLFHNQVPLYTSQIGTHTDYDFSNSKFVWEE